MLCNWLVYNRKKAEASNDEPLLVLLMGAFGLDRLSGGHAYNRRHVGRYRDRSAIVIVGVFDNEVSSVSRKRVPASGPSHIVDESSYGSGKRRRREAARRGNRRPAPSGAELELGVMVLGGSGVAKGESG